MVRAGGIEPPTTAWKAVILPLNHARAWNFENFIRVRVVLEAGKYDALTVL